MEPLFDALGCLLEARKHLLDAAASMVGDEPGMVALRVEAGRVGEHLGLVLGEAIRMSAPPVEAPVVAPPLVVAPVPVAPPAPVVAAPNPAERVAELEARVLAAIANPGE